MGRSQDRAHLLERGEDGVSVGVECARNPDIGLIEFLLECPGGWGMTF